MEIYKDAFEKFISKIDNDMTNLENKKIEEINNLKKISKDVNEIEGKLFPKK